MTNPPDMPGQIGKYRLESVLGKGAMGVVYRAFDPLIERTVALKTVRLDVAEAAQAQDMIERFRKEAQAAGRLQHPNIVAIHEYGETGDLAYIAMEFVDGTPLSALLGDRPAALAQALDWMDDLLAALDYSHERGVVHRDIKPANLLVTREGRIKISDFGIARIESSTLTQTGTMLGTPSYMSPEQFRGDPVDGRSDLFSAGIVLYQLLTGKRPFSGSATTVMQQILNHTPAQPSQFNGALPAGLDPIVLRALEKDPARRHASASAMRQALAGARQALSHGGGPEPVPDSDATILVPSAAMPASSGTRADATSPTAGTADLAPWKQAVFPQLEQMLTHQIGPMAKLLLRKVGATAPDFDTLGQQLLLHIPSPLAKERFEQNLAQLRASLLPATLTDAGDALASGGTGAPPPLSPEFVAAIVPALTLAIGPIAAIVAKRAARQAPSRDSFLSLVAHQIEAEPARLRFLEMVGNTAG